MLTLGLLVSLTVILASVKAMSVDYKDLLVAPGLSESLKTTQMAQLAPYMKYVERITYCSDNMSTYSRTFKVGGADQSMPEFVCEKMAGDDYKRAFSECAICFRVAGEPLEPTYLLDMRYKHTNGIPRAVFNVWSHPKNLFKLPPFNDFSF